MVDKQEFLEMIDHCLLYSGKSQAVVFYRIYKEIMEKSMISVEEKEACKKVLSMLVESSLQHQEILQNLKKDVEKNGKSLY